jgi:hypothetical protein
MAARTAKAAAVLRHISRHSLRVADITDALNARTPLSEAQILARNADSRATERYDRDRGNHERQADHFLVAGV